MTKSTVQVTTPSELEILMTRVFDAPRAFVFEALTKPELVQRWLLGPEGHSMIVCEIDFRVGGRYRYVWRLPDGAEMGLGGAFREIVAPERIVHSESFDDFPGESIVTSLLAEKNGKTTLSTTMRFDSKEARDGALHSGMEHGVEASYARLQRIYDAERSAEKRA
jgi:uncharacterized protein YndB with AHSA1/START domain